MTTLRLVLFIFASLIAIADPVLADAPTSGDAIIWDNGSCSLRHVDTSAGTSHVISQWGCGGPTVGAGPTDWEPYVELTDLILHSDGWFYLIGSDVGGFDKALYRIEATNGTREYVSDLPDGTSRLAIWPDPSFFPPTVAALAGSSAVILGLVVSWVAMRNTKP